MSAPPVFKDIGKSVKDLFSKNFGIGETKVEVKSKTSSGIELKAVGTRSAKTSNISGELEASTTFNAYGLKLTEKWSTDNLINVEAESSNYLSKGLTVGVEAAFSPAGAARSVQVNSQFKNSAVNTKFNVDLLSGPLFVGSAVAAYENFLFGYEAGYNVQSGKVTKSDIALGLKGSEYELVGLFNGKGFTGSVFHQVNQDVQFGAQIDYARSEVDTNIKGALGGKFQLDTDAFVKAKADTKGVVTVSYTQNLRKGISTTVASQFGGAADSNKLGLALNFAL